jgi:hypothetical protein
MMFYRKFADLHSALGAEFKEGLKVPKDDINIYTAAVPVKVTHQYNNDADFHQSVVDMYELIQMNTSIHL